MMQLRSYPQLLVLALSLPEISHALGLGTLRVESRLNEPLSAQIEILGATPEELKAMRASVASPELFQRYGVERPGFLSSATISIGTDADGKPALYLHSSDAFTEPLVEFLVDLRTGQQELVRDYSLLLDPARAAPALTKEPVAAASDAASLLAPGPAIELPTFVLPASAFSSAAAPSLIVAARDPEAVKSETQYRVVASDTLRAIARRAGARSDAEQERLMLAIFEANRDAFAGNINLLHSGALLTIPATTEIQVFNSADVEREIRAQTLAWRRSARPAYKPPAAAQIETQPVAATAPVSEVSDVSAVVAKMTQLEGQMLSIRRSLGETSRQIASASARLGDMERRQTPAPPNRAQGALVQARPLARQGSLSPILGVLALLLGALAFAFRRFLAGRSAPRVSTGAAEPTLEAPLLDRAFVHADPAATEAVESYSVAESALETVPSAPVPAAAPGRDDDAIDGGTTMELTQLTDIDIDTLEGRGPPSEDGADTVMLVNLANEATQGGGTALDYNLSDLDGNAQHLEMPGSLQDRPVFVERRKNVVDTLMAALQRDPTRNDLRLKLLETLYTTAATNLRAFKEVARDLARHPERLKAEEWQQVLSMGRHLAAEDELFAEPVVDDKVA